MTHHILLDWIVLVVVFSLLLAWFLVLSWFARQLERKRQHLDRYRATLSDITSGVLYEYWPTPDGGSPKLGVSISMSPDSGTQPVIGWGDRLVTAGGSKSTSAPGAPTVTQGSPQTLPSRLRLYSLKSPTASGAPLEGAGGATGRTPPKSAA